MTQTKPKKPWWQSLFAKNTPPPPPPPRTYTLEEAENLVCFCLNVTKQSVQAAVDEHGFTTLEQVCKHLNAGTHCGSCHPYIKTFLPPSNDDDVS